MFKRVGDFKLEHAIHTFLYMTDSLCAAIYPASLQAIVCSSFAYDCTATKASSVKSALMAPKKNPKRAAVDNTEKKAKQAKGFTDLPNDLVWSEVTSEGDLSPLLYLSSNILPGRKKIAGFDIDWTLIQTASGRKFATGSKDWLWLYDCVKPKLQELDKDGYRICFFTNQAGIEKKIMKPMEIRSKIEAMIQDLNIPVLAFVSTGTNHFRKPSTEMWRFLESNCNGSIEVDRSNSMYVGDAAGRAKGWSNGKPKDFSCGDRMFAANLKVEFQTPEEFFLGEPPVQFEWRSVDPKTVKVSSTIKEKVYASKEKEMVIMNGPPASGKSSFSKRYFTGYVHINRDTLKTAEKCLKAAGEAVSKNKSLVIDNTNPSKSVRAEYIDLAKSAGYSKIRCFVMKTPLDLAHHLNFVRMNLTDGEVRRIPDVAYNIYKKGFETPSVDEGFTEIVNVEFEATFDDDHLKELFYQWTA